MSLTYIIQAIILADTSLNLDNFISQLIVVLPAVAIIVGFAAAYLRIFIQKEINVVKDTIIDGIKSEFAQANLVKVQLEGIQQQILDYKERLRRLEATSDEITKKK